MTLDPYAPPQSELEPAAPRDPRPRRTLGVVLGLAGIVIFWTALVLTMTGALPGGGAPDRRSLVLGFVGLLAAGLHVVGFGVAVAKQRENRLAGVLVNLIPLALIIGLVFVGVRMKR